MNHKVERQKLFEGTQIISKNLPHNHHGYDFHQAHPLIFIITIYHYLIISFVWVFIHRCTMGETIIRHAISCLLTWCDLFIFEYWKPVHHMTNSNTFLQCCLSQHIYFNTMVQMYRSISVTECLFSPLVNFPLYEY
jgi:hypothetical protein